MILKSGLWREGSGESRRWVFDRAVADPEWLRARLAEAESGKARRALVWGQEAFARADLHICWSVTKDETTALALEAQVRNVLRAHGLLEQGLVGPLHLPTGR